VDEAQKFEVVPPALNAGEAQFVRHVRDFWNREKDASMAGKEVYVLRNLSRGKGVGFFENSGFYPDFILWVLDRDTGRQCIIFVEPHGMLYAKAYTYDERRGYMSDCRDLPGGLPGEANAMMFRSMRSSSPLRPMTNCANAMTAACGSRAKFAEHHILFPEVTDDYDFVGRLLKNP